MTDQTDVANGGCRWRTDLVDRLCAWAIPDSIAAAAPDELRRAWLILAFTLIAMPSAFVFSVIYYTALHTAVGGVGLVGIGCLVAGTPLVLRRSRSVALAGNYLTAQVFAAVWLCALTVGERSSAAVMYLVLTPIISVCVCGRRWGALWTLASTAAVAAILILNLAGALPAALFSDDVERLLLASGVVGLVLTVLVDALAYDRLRESALDQVRREKQIILELQRELIDASRRAGMADAAAATLHNVGNTLNSLTVSIGVLREHTRALGPERIERAAQLLRSAPGGLADLPPARAGQLAAYLEGCLDSAAEARAGLRQEVAELRGAVEQLVRVIDAQTEAVCAPR